MTAVTEADVAEVERAIGKAWWLFLVTGIAWVIIAFVILAFDPTSAATIGLMVGFVLIMAGVNEFLVAAMADGWRWAHALLGVLFVAVGISALMEPFQVFGVLALLIGWYLIFKGTFDVIFSIAGRDQIPLWGLLLATGIAEIVIGLWAVGYPGRSAWLLILWVGIGALLRGITEIVSAFQIRHLAHAA